MRVDGTFNQITSNRPSRIDAQNLVNQQLSYHFSYPDGQLLVGNATSNYQYILSRATGGSVTLREINEDSGFIMSPPGESTSYRVKMLDKLSTPTPITRDDLFFNVGRMQISSDFDSSSLIIDADGGVSNKALVTISDKNGEMTMSIPWTTFQNALCPQNCPVDQH